jgi:hypothetical protein
MTDQTGKNQTAACLTCNGTGRILAVWDRAGGPPGNGYIGCPDCAAGAAYDAAVQAETEAALLAFVQRIYDPRRERLRTHMDEAKREAEELHGTGATFQEGHVWGYFDGLEWAFRNDLGLSNAEDEWWDRHYPPVKT